MAGWFAVVLLGRVLVFIGLRQSMADSGRRHLLMDFAVAAAALSVTLEVAWYGMAAAAGGVLESGDEAGMLAIDQVAAGLNLMIGGGLGLAILSSAYVMWRSGLFPMVLNVVGVVSGVALVGAGCGCSGPACSCGVVLRAAWSDPRGASATTPGVA